MMAFSIKNLISPSLEARIFRKIIKPNIQDLNNFSYKTITFLTIIAMLGPSIISTGVVQGILPFYIVIGMVFSAIVGIAIFLSSLLVSGAACGIMNSLCFTQQQTKPNIAELTWIVDFYQEINAICSPFIFITFTFNVFVLTVNSYLIAMNLTGCTSNLVSILTLLPINFHFI